MSARNNINGTIRKGNPQVGDLALWYNSETGKGHVEFVTTAKDKQFTTYGAGSGTVPKEMGKSKNGIQWLSTDYPKIGSLGAGGAFLGFWTPHK